MSDSSYYGTFPKGGPFQGRYVLIYAASYAEAVHMMNTQFNGSWQSVFEEFEFVNHIKGHHSRYEYDARLCVLRSKYYNSWQTTGTVIRRK